MGEDRIGFSVSQRNVLASKSYPDMTVRAMARGGSCTVRVLQSGSILTRPSHTEIARLDVAPLTEATALFGMQDGSWGLLHVGTDGGVTIYHLFGPDTLTWSAIDASLTFTVA